MRSAKNNSEVVNEDGISIRKSESFNMFSKDEEKLDEEEPLLQQ